MNKTLRITLIVLAVVVIGAALFFAGFLLGRPAVRLGRTVAPAYSFDQRFYDFGPGIMRRSGRMGPGMMDNWRDGFGLRPGMMGRRSWGRAQAEPIAPLTIDDARTAAQEYIKALGVDGLETGEVMIFDNHAYVVVMEAATKLGAFELLIDPASRLAYPERGPNMMWNLKYGGVNHQGMMGRGGMMGGWRDQQTAPAQVSSEMPVTADEARTAAQEYLDQQSSGATASAQPVQFYGYYTFDFERNGTVAGMLSVNGFSRQVFPHIWHGTFVEEAE